LPVYVDSPMAVDVTAIYLRHREEHDLDMRNLANDGRNALRSRQLTLVRSAVQSKGLNDLNGPIIIIAASGMATGGRILHHLRLRLPDPRTTVLFTGFQAAGTRGRALLDGTRSVRIFGEEVPVRARTERIDGLSAHADRDELLKWLAGFGRPPSRTRLVHGEPQAADCLRAAIEHRLGWPVRVANETEVVTP